VGEGRKREGGKRGHAHIYRTYKSDWATNKKINNAKINLTLV